MTIQLFNGDCLEVMDKLIADGIKVDAVITDPPYGIDYQSSWRTDRSKRLPKILNDKKPFVEFISKLKDILKPCFSLHIFTRWDIQQKFIDELEKYGFKCKNVLIWDKKIHGMGDLKTAYGSRYESILFSSSKDFRFINKRPTDIIECCRVPAMSLIHPNEKPVSLIETLINQCIDTNGPVLDLFMGSGTTGVACKKLNRNFIGIELDKKYFNIAQRRIEDAEAEE